MANGIMAETALPPLTTSKAMPGARLALVLLLGINLFNYIDRQVLSAVVPHIRADLLLPSDEWAGTKIGALALAFMVAYMLIAPVFGWLADRYSRWRLIGIGVILWSLASGASGVPWPVPFALAYYCLFATRCLVGIGEAAYGPAAPTLISDLYPVKVRGKVLAWFYAAIPVGSALGYTLGGMVVNTWGLEWRWAFYLVVPPGILLGLWCFFMHEPTRGQADALGHAHTARLRDCLTLLHTKSYVLDTLGMTAMTFALGALALWMPDYLVHRGAKLPGPLAAVDATTGFGGIVVLSGFAATLLGGICGDWLRPRFSGSYFLVSGGGMLVGFVMLLLVLFRPFPEAWLWIFLAVFFLFFNTGPSNTILANVTHPAIRSSAFAINIFMIHAFGDAGSPLLVGMISDGAAMLAKSRPEWMSENVAAFLGEYNGLNTGFLVVSLMTLVGGVIWLWGARYLERDTELATQRLDPGAPGM